MGGRWIFGYGSLVSPVSFGRTLGRELQFAVDVFEATLTGYGRRWNYATAYGFSAASEPGAPVTDWVAVALGLERAEAETTNGVVVWVDDHELADLDRRERRYDRVDVGDLCVVDGGPAISAPVQTYVPHAVAVTDYEAARDRGGAAVARHYWELVDAAFVALGDDRRERYLATTPPPDVPIVTVPPEQVPPRHRTHVR